MPELPHKIARDGSIKKQLGQVVQAAVDLLKGGAARLIEAAAKGAGEAMVKGG